MNNPLTKFINWKNLNEQYMFIKIIFGIFIMLSLKKFKIRLTGQLD